MKANRCTEAMLVLLINFSVLNADVIVHDAKLILYSDPEYILTTTNFGGGLAVGINNLGMGNYQFSDFLAGPAYSLFPSSSGQEFTPLQAGGAGALVPGISTQLFSLNETKYYAYWEQAYAYEPAPGPISADNYGWVSLTRTPSGLVITDSATAIGGGIIVGTYTQIPEPATVLLFGLGGIGAWLLRRNRAKSRETEE